MSRAHEIEIWQSFKHGLDDLAVALGVGVVVVRDVQKLYQAAILHAIVKTYPCTCD